MPVLRREDSTAAAPAPFVQDAPPIARWAARTRRHWDWARSGGVGRLIEEDGLDPFARLTTAIAKRRWRRRHGVERGTARAVFVVGVQRSGTNMLVRGLEAAPEVEVHNENDRRAFARFLLRDDAVIAHLVATSRHEVVLFKPLCDSHRVVDLLEGLGTPVPPLAIWAYRGVDGRVGSAVTKFGDVNLRVVRDIAAGRGGDRWQGQRVSGATSDRLAQVDWDRATPATGAAAFWYLRNVLFFELGLDRRPDVWLASYESTVIAPQQSVRELCSFLGFRFHPRLAAHVDGRAAAPRRDDIDPVVRAWCDELQDRLDAVVASRAAAPIG